jgi:hypothetical protein
VLWRIYISRYFLDYCVGWNRNWNVRREDLQDISQENSVSWKCVVILFSICIVVAVVIRLLGNCVWCYKCGKNSVITDSYLDGTVPSGRFIPSVWRKGLWIAKVHVLTADDVDLDLDMMCCCGQNVGGDSCYVSFGPGVIFVLLWAECGRRQLLPVFWYWHHICVNDWRKPWKLLRLSLGCDSSGIFRVTKRNCSRMRRDGRCPSAGNMDLVFVESTFKPCQCFLHI